MLPAVYDVIVVIFIIIIVVVVIIIIIIIICFLNISSFHTNTRVRPTLCQLSLLFSAPPLITEHSNSATMPFFLDCPSPSGLRFRFRPLTFEVLPVALYE